MKTRAARTALLLLIPALLLAWAPAPAQQGLDSADWPSYGGDRGSTKYTALDQIDRDNVGSLEVAWTWESPDNEEAAKRASVLQPSAYKVTPLMVDGVLYASTSYGQVAAIDAATGEQKWVFDTEDWRGSRPTNLGYNHRGVGYWTDGEQARILMPTNQAWLWALDAYTGEPVGDFGDGRGKIDLTLGLGRPVQRRTYSVISAPMILGDTVVVGSSILDGPSRKEMPPGHVRGFDVRTGEQKWIFHTIPQGDVPGERTSPTQPFPTWPLAYEHQGMESDDMLISFTPELHEAAKKIRDRWVYGPLFTPPSLQGTILLPGWGGGANWFGAGVDPETATIYIPSYTMPMVVKLNEPDGARSNFRYQRGMSGLESLFLLGPMGLPLTKPPYGRMTAIDLNTGEHKWMLPLGDGPRAQIERITGEDPGPLGGPPAAGPLVTKTLLFQAQGGGPGMGGPAAVTDPVLRAHDKATGEIIQEVGLERVPSGTPMSYAVGGRQFIALSVGGEAEAGIIALALPQADASEAGP